MILIISAPGDTTVDLVMPGLRRAGVEVLWWDEARYPVQDRFTVTFDRDGGRRQLRSQGRTYDLDRIGAVWDRRPGPLTVDDRVTDGGHRDFCALVADRFLESLWAALPARWLPGPPIQARAANSKLVQLAKAVELGFDVPDTVITNDPDELVPAWTAAEGRLITKVITYRDLSRDGERLHPYTERVHRRDLAGRHRLRFAPAILQPDVAKALEIRVTVVGDEVFAAEIDSQSSRLTAQDWRHYEGLATSYLPHHLPDDIAEGCRRLVAALGLSFGAIDLILTPAGQYVFLELNVGGEWGWVEETTGLPIGDAVANWLSSGEPDRSPTP